MTRLVAGLDLGSTGIKLLVLDDQQQQILMKKRPTPWESDPTGAVIMRSEALLAVVDQLLCDAASDLMAMDDARVVVLSVTGMGETGYLVDSMGTPVAPAFAWFDQSGHEVVDALPEHLRSVFAGRTGLPWGVQVSAAKIAHLRRMGTDLAGTIWLSLPEFVVHALGGPAVAERSLVARTGLINIDTGEPWLELLDHLGVRPTIIPPIVDAGMPLGIVDAWRTPVPFHGVQLTVAGHDHLVSSLASGSVDPSRYHVSMGTAEVLLRVVSSPLTFDARSRLATHLINCVPHVVPGMWVVVAGIKTGLLMRRALSMLGIADDHSANDLDQAVLALPADQESKVVVTGARNDDGVLSISIETDGVGPAALMKSIIHHGNDEIRHLVAAIDAELPRATSTLLTGGWASWASIREARSEALPELQCSERSQDTAFGAALFALECCDEFNTPSPKRSIGALS